MAKRELHAKALEMRFQGMSYSQIKRELGVGKGTLSAWLRDFPLSQERIRELRDKNEQRIEKCRETKARKSAERRASVRKKAAQDIGKLSGRDLFIAGLFLYWGEGTKTSSGVSCMTNTDPAVLQCFIEWLGLMGVSKQSLIVKLHLYSDMDCDAEVEYWSGILGIQRSAFRKPYIKKSKRQDITYYQKFIHGTCNVMYLNQYIQEYILLALEHLRKEFADTEGT